MHVFFVCFYTYFVYIEHQLVVVTVIVVVVVAESGVIEDDVNLM